MIRDGRSWSGRERNCCFLNTADGKFSDISAVSGFDFIDDSRALAVGDWDGDGVADDLLVCRGDGRQKGMLQIWRTEDGVIQSDDIVTWQSLTMTAPLGRHGRMVRNDAQDSTIALRSYDRLILYTLPSLGTVTAVPEGTLAALLQAPAA